MVRLLGWAAMTLVAGLFAHLVILHVLRGGPASQPTRVVLSDDLLMVEDPQTGCQYLQVRGAHPIVPRTSSDGKSHEGCGTRLENK